MGQGHAKTSVAAQSRIPSRSCTGIDKNGGGIHHFRERHTRWRRGLSAPLPGPKFTISMPSSAKYRLSLTPVAFSRRAGAPVAMAMAAPSAVTPGPLAAARKPLVPVSFSSVQSAGSPAADRMACSSAKASSTFSPGSRRRSDGHGGAGRHHVGVAAALDQADIDGRSHGAVGACVQSRLASSQGRRSGEPGAGWHCRRHRDWPAWAARPAVVTRAHSTPRSATIIWFSVWAPRISTSGRT